jgi:hypothetical protein
MFCKVTLMGDARSQNQQLMKAVRAIATASANSTPSVTGSTAYNNASTGQYEVITTVLDNTVAGGWTVKSDQTTLNSSIISTNSFLESLLLYRDTGKSGLPYLWFSMIEGAYTSSQINYGPFLSFGYATTLANCNYGSGYNVTGTYSAGTASTSVYAGGCPFTTSTFIYDYNRVAGISSSATRVYYISATSEFIHIQQDVASTSVAHCGSWFHLGLRTNSSWEDNYNDNPYWVALWCSQGSNSAYTGQASDAAGYWTVMRTIDTTTGTVGSAVNIWRATNPGSSAGSYTTMSPLTNVQYAATYSTPYYRQIAPQNPTTVPFSYPTNYSSAGSNGGTGYTLGTWQGTGSTTALQTDIFNVYWATATQVPSVGVTSDSTTNALISPALPMYIRYTGTSNFGGYMKNLFQGGIYSSAAELDLYHVPDASYTIDGTTYIGIRMGYVASSSGPNPRQLLYVKAS